MQQIHISRRNTKLGPAIPCVNLPAGQTCPPNAPCFKKCYARKGRMAYGGNKERAETNLTIWKTDPLRYEQQIVEAAYHSRFFRWHSGGDIPDMSYLDMMIRVAGKLPHTSFLVFTKQWQYINKVLKNVEKPQNLTIVMSAWGDFLPDNPHNLPVAYIRFKGKETSMPANTIECQSYCGDCVMTGNSCWDLGPGMNVCFNEH